MGAARLLIGSGPRGTVTPVSEAPPKSSRKNIGLKDRLLLVIATGFGSGMAPVAPGTFGSVVGALIAWPILLVHPLWCLAAAVLLFPLGVVASAVAERHFGGKDPGAVVIDEIVGVLITVAFVPFTPLHLAVGFALFRLFDITKPPPCRWAECRFAGGFGVMADDVMAGIYAAVVLVLAVRLLGI